MYSGSSAPKRVVMANVLTSSYRIVGKIDVGTSGLVGMLTNPHSAFVELYEASMARIHEPRKLADRMPVVRLVKRGIVIVGLGRREDVGPQSIARGGFGRLSEYAIRALTSTYEIEGVLEYSGRFDLAGILVDGMGEFLPLYNAKVRAIQFPELEMESPALIFNRRKVDAITQVKEQNAEA